VIASQSASNGFVKNSEYELAISTKYGELAKSHSLSGCSLKGKTNAPVSAVAQFLIYLIVQLSN
jgi:hypothetical protein